jgi:PKD domain-containing protein
VPAIRYAHRARLLRAKRAELRRFRRAHRHARHRASHIMFKGTVFAGLNAPGFAFGTGSQASGYATPSDTTGAIGPSNFVQFTNGDLVVYDRSLAPVSGGESAIEDFVGLPAGTDVAGDPQMQWDPASQRWYYLAYASKSSDSSINYLMFGWSKTASPLPLGTGWCRFGLSTGQVFPDFPKLGHDNTQLIFGANGFQDIDEVSALVFVVPKPGPGTTCPSSTVATQFGSAAHPLITSNGGLADSPIPANTADSSATGYVVAADAPDSLMLWHVSSGPRLTPDRDIPVPTFLVPSNVPQPGTSNLIDTLDSRLTQAVAHADPAVGGREAVWTQHTIAGPGGRSVVRWYEVVAPTRSIRQRGTVSDPTNFVFNGAISPAGDGRSAVVVYNAGGPGLRTAVRVSSRRPAAALGTVGSPLAIASSTASFHDFSCTPPTPKDPPICRWGDYPGATPDPNASNVVWLTQQYSAGARWLTRNFAIQVLAGGPTAHLSVATSPTFGGRSIKLDGSASTDSLAAITSYNWDLDGNGTFETKTGTTPTVRHTFHLVGKRRVRLRVIDANGDASDASVNLTLLKPPPTAKCKAATKKRKQLAAAVTKLKRRLASTTSSSTRRRLSSQLASKRAKLKKARAAETKACRI